MTKKDIVQRCHKNKPDFSKALIEKVLNFVLKEISLSLSRGESVKISGFGTWQRRKVRGKFSVRFKPSKKLIAYLNSSELSAKIRK